MKRLLEALRACSEARAALNGLAADAEESVVTEHRNKLEEAEKELRSACEEEERAQERELVIDSEERERLELRSRVPDGEYLRAAIQGRPISSEAVEFAAACGCPGAMPLEMFPQPVEQREAEERADAHTPGPAAGTQSQTAPIAPAVFRGSIADFLGIEMPTVGAGQAVYPVITKSLTAGMVAAGAGNDATAATITPQTVAPIRLQGRVQWRKEDAALLGDLDSALLGNLSSVLRDALDNQVVNGDGVSPNLRGLTKQLPLSAAGSDAAATDFAAMVQRAASMVDGLHSNGFGDLSAALSVEAYTYLASLFRAPNTDLSGLDWLMARLGGLRASGRISQAERTNQDGARSQVLVRRRGQMVRAAVLPVWQGVSLIRDEITGAKTGEIAVNADMLIGGISFLYPAAFSSFVIATGAKS